MNNDEFYTIQTQEIVFKTK